MSIVYRARLIHDPVNQLYEVRVKYRWFHLWWDHYRTIRYDDKSNHFLSQENALKAGIHAVETLLQSEIIIDRRA